MRPLILTVFVALYGLLASAQSLPCSPPCNTGLLTTTYAGSTRYYEAYFPAGVSASTPYPLWAILNGAHKGAYNSPAIDDQTTLQTFANYNSVAILWVESTVYDSSLGSPPGTPP